MGAEQCREMSRVESARVEFKSCPAPQGLFKLVQIIYPLLTFVLPPVQNWKALMGGGSKMTYVIKVLVCSKHPVNVNCLSDPIYLFALSKGSSHSSFLTHPTVPGSPFPLASTDLVECIAPLGEEPHVAGRGGVVSGSEQAQVLHPIALVWSETLPREQVSPSHNRWPCSHGRGFTCMSHKPGSCQRAELFSK